MVVEKWVNYLDKGFKKPKPPVDINLLRYAFANQGIGGLVRCAQQELGTNFKVTLVKDGTGGPEDPPAWVNLPVSGIRKGFATDVNFRLRLHMRRVFYLRMPLEMVVACIVHEFSHVILATTGSRYWKDEKLVDITAMYLGFAEICHIGRKHSIEIPFPGSASKTFRYSKILGYLSDYEAFNALRLIQERR